MTRDTSTLRRYDVQMVRSFAFTLGLAVLGSACSSGHVHSKSTDAPGTRSAAASRDLYKQGEARFFAGEAREAVTLWRAALLQLPEGPEADRLRHKVILRMGHALLVAYERGDVEALLLARQVLGRYVVWHDLHRRGLPGAADERADAASLLSAAEATIAHLELLAGIRREPAPEEPAPLADAVASETTSGALHHADAGSPPEHVDPRAADAPLEVEVAVAADDEELSDAEAGRPTLVLDGTPHHREIVVKPYGSDFFALPGVKRFFMPGMVGAPLFTPPRPFLDKPRVLVRAGLTSVQGEVARDDRRPAKARARAAVVAARGRLARCYMEAVGRGLDADIRLVVDLEVAADGALAVTSLHLTTDEVFDHRSQKCVRDALQAATPSAPPPPKDVKVQLPIALFVQLPGSGPMDEDNVRPKGTGGRTSGFDYGMDNGIAGVAHKPY